MNKDKKILYLISALTPAALLAALIADATIGGRIISACVLAIAAAVTAFFIKKRSSLSIHKREALLLMTVVGVLFVTLTEISGTFLGFYKNPYFMNADVLVSGFIPITVIIITIEIIRSVILAQKNRTASFLCYISCVIADVMMHLGVIREMNVNAFMDLVGLTLLPAITANILYHYVSKRFGILPNVSFRIITTLYIFFLPMTTAMSNSITALIKLLLPIAIIAFLSALYDKEPKRAREKKTGWVGHVLTALVVLVMLSIVMIVSCQFSTGALVIATDSMTGEINRGDVIIYERYDDQTIKEGQVIVFERGDSKIVHRVVKIENVRGVNRYYTKGDANESMDIGYIEDSQIIGLTDIKISYIGFPTLWLHEIVSGETQ